MTKEPDPNDDAPERTALYRMFDREGILLYVGISKSFGRRWSREAVTCSWWPEVQRQTVDWYPSRPEAEAAEIAAIKAERPRYNIMHAVKATPPVVPAEGVAHPDPRRFVHFLTWDPADGGSNGCPDSPEVVAPGTYLITFAYDPDAEPTKAVAVTKCVLVDGGDEVSCALGGSCRVELVRPGEPLPPTCECYICTENKRAHPVA